MRPGKTSTVHGCLVRQVSCGWPDTTTTDKEKHSALQQSCFFFSFFFWASLFLFFFASFLSFCALFFPFLPFFNFFVFAFFLFLPFCCLFVPFFPLPLLFFLPVFAFFSFFAHLCCRKILHLGGRGTPALAQTIASLLLRQGGLGLRNIVRLRGAAHWSIWADCLKMVQTPSSSVWQHRCIIEAIRDQERLSQVGPCISVNSASSVIARSLSNELKDAFNDG